LQRKEGKGGTEKKEKSNADWKEKKKGGSDQCLSPTENLSLQGKNDPRKPKEGGVAPMGGVGESDETKRRRGEPISKKKKTGRGIKERGIFLAIEDSLYRPPPKKKKEGGFFGGREG